MTTLAHRATDAKSARIPSTGQRIPLWAAVVFSRLIVLAAGASGALFSHPLRGWQAYDPTRISTSLGSVGNVIAASAVRWDAIGYITLAQHGYTTTGSTRLFPLYPLLIHVTTLVVPSPVIAGVLISITSFTIGLTLVHRIASEEVGPRAAYACITLIAFAPWSFVFSAVYSESLLFALATATFYLARRGRFELACVAAAAAALTHIQGALLVAPLAFMFWDSRDRPYELRKIWSASLLALTLPVLALVALFVYMHAQGWGWLAQITSQNVEEASRTLVGTPVTLFDTFRDIVAGVPRGVSPPAGLLTPRAQNGLYLAILVISVAGLASAWRRLPKEYALYAALVILVCTSSAVATEPLKGLGRYVLPIFPLWIGAAAWLEEHRFTPVVLMLSATMLIIYTFEFARWTSVF